MFQIIEIKLYELHNPEYLQVIKLLLKMCANKGVVALKIVDEYNNMQTMYLKLDGIYQQQLGSTITGRIEKSDFRRDRAITGIVMYVDSNTYYFDEAIAEAAVILKADLAKYGSSIARANYATESTILDNIAKEWKTIPKMVDAVKLLSLEAWVEELEAANVEFADLYLLRNTETSALPDDTVGKLRVEADALYLELSKMLESQGRVSKFVPPFDSAIREWNTILEDYNTMIARRQAAPKTEEKDEVVP